MRNYVPGISWAVLIFILSSVSSGTLKLPDFWDLFSLDKAAHAIFYFLLYFLWARGLIQGGNNQRRIFIILLVLCISYGGLIELYQGYFLPSRHGDWVDEVANSIGVIAGGLYFWKAKKTFDFSKMFYI